MDPAAVAIVLVVAGFLMVALVLLANTITSGLKACGLKTKISRLATCVCAPPRSKSGPALSATPPQVAAWIAQQPAGGAAGAGGGSGADA